MQKLIVFLITLSLITPAVGAASAQDFKHIDQMFDVRESMAIQGKGMPDAIKKTSGNDLRILERVFELNTSALVTIEAYFRVFKIAYSINGDKLTPDTVSILNEWLDFIQQQCGHDTTYLEEATTSTKSDSVLQQIKTTRINIKKLASVTALGKKENQTMIKR